MKNQTSLPSPVFKTKYYFLRNRPREIWYDVGNKSNYFFNIHAIRVFTKPNTITINTNSFKSFSKANNVQDKKTIFNMRINLAKIDIKKTNINLFENDLLICFSNANIPCSAWKSTSNGGCVYRWQIHFSLKLSIDNIITTWICMLNNRL